MNLFRIFVLSCFLFAPVWALQAQERLLIVTEEWAPYNYTDAKGEVLGLATDNIKKMMAQANIDYDIKVLPWSMAYTLAQNKPNIMLYTAYRTKEREGKFQWLCPIVETGGIKAYKLSRRNDVQVATLQDMKKYNIAVSNKNVQYEFLIAQGFIPGVDMDVTVAESSGLRMLLLGRVDIIMQEDAAIKERLKKLNKPPAIVTELMTVLPETTAKCAAFSLDTDPKLVEKLSGALAEIKR